MRKGQSMGTIITWWDYIPDPMDDPEDIGDKLNLQILAVVNDAYISGHWELTKDYGDGFVSTIFVPDWETKQIITNDMIDCWCWTRYLP